MAFSERPDLPVFLCAFVPGALYNVSPFVASSVFQIDRVRKSFQDIFSHKRSGMGCSPAQQQLEVKVNKDPLLKNTMILVVTGILGGGLTDTFWFSYPHIWRA